MHDVKVYKATEADIAELAGNMRDKDRLEAVQWTANDPALSCQSSLRQSDIAYAVYAEDGSLLCVAGAKVDNVIEETAVLWSLSTAAVDRNRIAFVKATKGVVDRIMREMPEVREFHNWVSNDYHAAQRWVEWFGGTFSLKNARAGFGHSVFREFYIENPHYKGGK